MKKNRNYKLIATALMLCCACYTQAQRLNASNLNAWVMYNGDHKISPHWGVHLEAQVRRNKGLSEWQQLLLRTGLNFQVNPNVLLTAGYCFVETFPYGRFPVPVRYPENRFWEQIQLKNQTGKVEWSNRLRIEQRFSNLPVSNDSGRHYQSGHAIFSNRFRSLNRWSIPFKGKEIHDRSAYISMYDEIFINFGSHVGLNIFDQNRAYLALGYKIHGLGRLEAGFLEQTLVKPDGRKIENNHTLQLGILSNLDFIKK